MDSWISPYPVTYWFTKVQDVKLGLILEVGPIKNRDKRIELLENIKKRSDLRVPKNALLPEARYTRVYSKYVEFQDWDNEDLIVERMEELYLHDAKRVNATIVGLVTSFDW
jgi:hypothetical protein